MDTEPAIKYTKDYMRTKWPEFLKGSPIPHGPTHRQCVSSHSLNLRAKATT